MEKLLLFLMILLIVDIEPSNANNPTRSLNNLKLPEDSTRLVELDRYWAKLSKTVQEGDFEGYEALYHNDAVVVFTSGKNKISEPIAKALASWKKGFNDTKEGKQNDKVEFRFSQRIGSETTAHETGIFFFTSFDSNNKVKAKSFTHFEVLLIKRDNEWYALMEYQKSEASQEEWDALK